MAGRGRNATLPAWMTTGVGSGTAAGASSVTPTIPASVPARPAIAPSAHLPSALHGAPVTQSYGGRPGAVLPYAAPIGHAPALFNSPASASAAAAGVAGAIGGTAAGSATGGGWTAHTAPDGRQYYYHAATKTSSYEKPDELKTAAERAMPVCAWAEHKSPTGQVYFYNKDTKQSVWAEPAELTEHKRRLVELGLAVPTVGSGAGGAAAPSISSTLTPAPVAAAVSAPSAPVVAPPFRTSGAISISLSSGGGASAAILAASAVGAPATAAGGVVAYGNVARDAAAAEAAAASSATLPAAATTGRIPEKKKVKALTGDPKKWETASRDECAAGFIELLRDHDVRPGDRWADLQAELAKDYRYAALKSMGEKRQAFAEFQTRRLKEEKEEKRRRGVAARESFVALLAARRDAVGGDTTLAAAAAVLGSDPAWRALDGPELEPVRAELFDEFRADLLKRERAAAAAAAAARDEAFRALLVSRPDIVHTQSRWAEVKHSLAEHSAYTALDKEDRLRLFKEHVLGMERAEEEARRAEAEAERARIRDARSTFRTALHALANVGVLTADTQWRVLEADIRSSVNGEAVANGDGSNLEPTQNSATTKSDAAPLLFRARAALESIVTLAGADVAAELFAIEVDDADRLRRTDRRLLRDLIDDARVGWTLSDSVTPEMTFGDWCTRLRAAFGAKNGGSATPGERILSERPWNARYIFDDLHERAVEAAAAEERRVRRARERFDELLMDYYYRSDHVDTTWEDAAHELRRRTAFMEMPSELRRPAFDAYMERLRAKARARRARLDAERAREAAEREKEGGGVASGTDNAATDGADGRSGAPVLSSDFARERVTTSSVIAATGTRTAGGDEPEEGEMDDDAAAAAAEKKAKGVAGAVVDPNEDAQHPTDGDLRDEPDPPHVRQESGSLMSDSAVARHEKGSQGDAGQTKSKRDRSASRSAARSDAGANDALQEVTIKRTKLVGDDENADRRHDLRHDRHGHHHHHRRGSNDDGDSVDGGARAGSYGGRR